MQAARVLGFALEAAFKCAFPRGFSEVEPSHLRSIRLSGDIQVNNGRGFQKPTGPVYMKVAEAEQHFAHYLFQHSCTLLLSLGLNIFIPDRLGGSAWSHDLVCSFLNPAAKLVRGLLSVELKVVTSHFWEARLKDTRQVCEARLKSLKQKFGDKFGGIAILACKVMKSGKDVWDAIKTEVHLWDGHKWSVLKSVVPGYLEPAGCEHTGYRVKEILDALSWHKQQQGPPVARVTDFLREAGLSDTNAAQRVQAWNAHLWQEEKPLLVKIPLAPGKPPWCGTRITFMKVYQFILKKKNTKK